MLHERTEGMSEGAEKIINLLGHTGNISDIIKDHPDLVPYLDEYIGWRDKTLEQIERKTTIPPAAHSVARTLKKY